MGRLSDAVCLLTDAHYALPMICAFADFFKASSCGVVTFMYVPCDQISLRGDTPDPDFPQINLDINQLFGHSPLVPPDPQWQDCSGVSICGLYTLQLTMVHLK